MDLPKAIWQLDPYVGMFGDPFVQGTEKENGHVGNSLMIVASLLQQLMKEPGMEKYHSIFKELESLLESCCKLATFEVKDGAGLMKLLSEWKKALESLRENQFLMIPGGWDGKTSKGALIYLLERTNATSFRLIICNRGSGLEYHANNAVIDPEKIKYQSCAVLESIPAEKIFDMAFWSLMFSLWMNANPASEYHRVEVIYDVLLPWLAGKCLPQAWVIDPDRFWRTPQRSNTSSYKTVIEAIRYVGARRGISAVELKQLSFKLRQLMMKQVIYDLEGVLDPIQRVPMDKVTSLLSNAQHDGLIGLYFTSSACLAFHEKLQAFYAATSPRMKLFVVSLDQEPSSTLVFQEEWIEIQEPEKKKQLVSVFKLQTVPSIVFFEHAVSSILTLDGAQLVDTEQSYPFAKLPRRTIDATEQTLIEFGRQQMSRATLKAYDANLVPESVLQMSYESLSRVEHLVTDITAVDDSPDQVMKIVPPNALLSRYELLTGTGMDALAGATKEHVVPTLCDFLSLSSSQCTSLPQVLEAFATCKGLCDSLWTRATEGSSSSRLALQYQMIELISILFLEILPPPLDQIWAPTEAKTQLQCLQYIYEFILMFGQMWQSIQYPSRAYDSQRSIVALAALTLFDVIIRQEATDTPFEVSRVLQSYNLSYKICQNNRPLMFLTESVEIVHPEWMKRRHEILQYVSSLAPTRPALFEWHMPEDQLELKRYSPTVLFLQELLDAYGFPVIPLDHPNPPSEMEALMDWLFQTDESELLTKHVEIRFLRDVTVLSKFLFTMETTQVELMKKKMAPNRWQMWRLSFEENTRMKIRKNLEGLKWEVTNVRGPNQDIADIQVTGLNDRKIVFGEGLVIQSPARPERYITGIDPSLITEDDVMHAETLPHFSNTLSSEEAEALISYLTVPYARIPLILSFFSTRDRVTYLFNTELQDLIRAVVFEGGSWIDTSPVITHVPTVKEELGSNTGALLNELTHSSSTTVTAVETMLNAIKELGKASVYSPDASFILFMFEFGLDVERYIVYLQLDNPLSAYFHGFAKTTLERWQDEAEKEGDLRTACVAHSYLALLYSNCPISDLSGPDIAQMIGSLSYVRNWHGFGQDPIDTNTDLSPEERLKRWLQAHGVDTSNLSNVEKYMNRSGPLYLTIGRDCIQAPTLDNHRENGKPRPPSHVPEDRLFSFLQRHRRSIIQWFEQNIEARNAVLTKILEIALNEKQDHVVEWTESGTGRYRIEARELEIDLQTAEILWRRDGLKPVPDSMVQFGDFETIFGHQSLHCGLVSCQVERLWVKIIGTQYELMEWTESIDGIGCPQVLSTQTERKMYWQCHVCTYGNLNGHETEPVCEMCQTKMKNDDENENQVSGFTFQGKEFNQAHDIYATDTWYNQILTGLYPKDRKEIPYQLYTTSETQDPMLMIGLEEETYRQVFISDRLQLVEIFNLVSHGRRMYRKLIFTSNCQLSYHSLQPMALEDPVSEPALFYAGGNPNVKVEKDSSLVILRQDRTERYIPPRLLEGILPSVLLEAYEFWQNRDTHSISGTPLDEQSQWFSYPLSITLLSTGQARIVRQDLGYTLASVLDSSKECLKMVEMFTRIEDVSHLLIWLKDDAIQMIELPRLQLRFQPKNNALHLVDQAGWFISLDKKKNLFPNESCLLLQTEQQEYQYLVANHDLYRPTVARTAFPTRLLSNRGSIGWLNVMESRFYIYPVHLSQTFIQPKTLSATFYYILMCFYERQYVKTFELIAACTVDVPLTDEEKWVFGQFERTLTDRHPNAHACRLRLSLALRYSTTACPWHIHVELHEYYVKEPHVSLACRLSRLEQEELLSLCKDQRTAVLKQRIDEDVAGPTVRIGGLPFEKLYHMDANYVASHTSVLTRLKYKSPSPATNVLMNEELLKICIWERQIVGDELSGSNRNLGFLFLYQVLASKQMRLLLLDQDVSQSMGELLVRYLQLKQVRWGRETIEQGEQNIVISKPMVQLALIIQQPSKPWPAVPIDPDSLRSLQYGIQLYSKQSMECMVKTFLDFLELECAYGTSTAERPFFIPPALSVQGKRRRDGKKRSERLVLNNTQRDSCRVHATSSIFVYPLQDLQNYVQRSNAQTTTTIRSTLPFDVSHHSVAQSGVAKDFLQRLEQDVSLFAATMKNRQEEQFAGNLQQLIQDAKTTRETDRSRVSELIVELETLLNTIPSMEYRTLLERIGHRQMRIELHHATAAFLSSTMEEDLKQMNPFGPSIDRVDTSIQAICFLINRIGQVNRVLDQANRVRHASSKDAEIMYKELVATLSCRRSYFRPDATFDPRFLVFEYLFDLILRPRQVEMVNSFYSSSSRVQQMIMGAGKTTVVGPLLTLLLANQSQLVTQVMPSALLEQSRQILRQRFSWIMVKRIYTLEFDRAVEDDVELVEQVLHKLENARRNGDVIVASPESIKSLVLKIIEQLHSLEQHKDTGNLRFETQLTVRSEMADTLTKIIDLWQSGVLIMDEVDVLLHPLRSELNFPIGTKYPIDLAGHRWDLPIHLLNAVFDPDGPLTQLIQTGYDTHALQRTPHLVLLDLAFYHTQLLPVVAEYLVPWIKARVLKTTGLTDEILRTFLHTGESDQLTLEHSESIKLLNLAKDWLHSYLPHILAKINRVSYGLLEAESNDPRRFLAVPFIGKDVPSRSSEFAHPDILIGLSICAYRYEGLRISDVKRLINQLKQDYARQVGPRDQRPACLLFRDWLIQSNGDKERDSIPVLPLPLFQPTDRLQLQGLYDLVRSVPAVIHYYLRQLVFPACLIFQKMKLSACGHELGSSILFPHRIGFSGTPSNLLPLDLGTCEYEPTSDGKILNVLTDPTITSIEVKSKNWTAESLLYDIASAGTYHALIDTGALITGMENIDVASYLLQHLPTDQFEGVVFLDKSDRQMILVRDVPFPLNLLQCGIAPEHRFTFYDQIHTTGMDIKQYSMARAVLTIGKDMTFRDYAQGAYRMRGIGKGQTIHVFLIPEIQHQLENQTDILVQVPAWLVLNSMRMERMQLIQLSKQEIENVWRKQALKTLLLTAGQGRRRFLQNNLDRAIQLYREEISYDIRDDMSKGMEFHEKMSRLVSEHEALGFLQTSEAKERVAIVLERIHQLNDVVTDHDLNAEMVNENEIEAEEEAEEEAEQEEEKMSAYRRDDEAPHPWPVTILSSPSYSRETFYPLATFQPTETCPKIQFPSTLCLTNNFFRPEWLGLGSRRVKNVGIVLEWIPQATATLQTKIHQLFQQYMAVDGTDATTAASKAMEEALKTSHTAVTSRDERYFVVLSLAEGETIRRMIHMHHPALSVTGLALRTVDGRVLDSSFPKTILEMEVETQCLRFFNNEMYFTPSQLDALDQKGLANVTKVDRCRFFEQILILRRRERHLWADTPLAKLFTETSEHHLLHVRMISQQLKTAMQKKRKDVDLYLSYMTQDRLRYDQVEKLLQSQLHLGFSAADLSEFVRFLDQDQTGEISFTRLAKALDWSVDQEEESKQQEETWTCGHCTYKNTMDRETCGMCQEEMDRVWKCGNCTFSNPMQESVCGMCELNATGKRQVPRGKWVCDAEQGGCTFFNTNDLFYCQVCHRARPDLVSKRF